MLLIALSPPTTDSASIAVKLSGAVLASLSSGLGELSFLGLTHYYGHFALASWGSGTGGAGLVGAGAYVLATTTIGLSVRTSLLSFACLPAIMVAAFFGILPLEPLRTARSKAGGYEPLDQRNDDVVPAVLDDDPALTEHEGLLAASMHSTRSFSAASLRGESNAIAKFKTNLRRASRLFFPYMLPLLLVYIAEYTINQGVAPTLLFPLASSPFTEYRSFYPTYNAIYQTGVFISRSSTPFFRIHALYLPSLLQVGNLVLLATHAMFDFIPSVYIIFIVIFWEGLLGGLVYVSTFAEITDRVPREDREFSLGATTVSDSAGICIAGFVGMALEVSLCNYQVRHGRDYCRRT
ncbi:hypothetical protein, variant [Verruconis gallopava]|nr:hypothetical protein, variant [Verruconis gallopava]KIW06473.1 hypothetical protein, variant [Verruconis gallopava]